MSKLPLDGPLFRVHGRLAERYAAALNHAVGLACPLSDFNVDRLGWSPQLAATLGEDYLLSGALRYAIILSPNQSDAPLVRRRYSYEAPLIEQIYLVGRPTLLQLIEHEAVVIEIDNGQAFCRTASDLLGITHVEACWSTPRDTLGKTRQLLDLGQQLKQASRLLDNAFIDQMLLLVKEVGDPRRQPLPAEFKLAVSSLWADVAGGIYVLRAADSKPRKTYVITAQPDAELAHLPVTGTELSNPALVDKLHAWGWLRYVREEPLIRRRLAELEREALLAVGEDKPAAEAADRRRQLSRNEPAQLALLPVYRQLDAELKRLQGGVDFEPRRLGPEGRWAISAATGEANVIGHLLSRFVPYDYQMLALHQRRRIEQEWTSYSAAKQRYLTAQFPYIVQSFVTAAVAPPVIEPQQTAVATEATI